MLDVCERKVSSLFSCYMAAFFSSIIIRYHNTSYIFSCCITLKHAKRIILSTVLSRRILDLLLLKQYTRTLLMFLLAVTHTYKGDVRDRGATLRLGGGGTIHFFLLTLYNFKNIGEACAPLPPPPLPLRGPWTCVAQSCHALYCFHVAVFLIHLPNPKSVNVARKPYLMFHTVALTG